MSIVGFLVVRIGKNQYSYEEDIEEDGSIMNGGPSLAEYITHYSATSRIRHYSFIEVTHISYPELVKTIVVNVKNPLKVRREYNKPMTATIVNAPSPPPNELVFSSMIFDELSSINYEEGVEQAS